MDDVPPQDRFCDLVMTGGVASGVVYPWAIVEIARAYRFRNIGGTSVGAMAAALAAAAEYGRRVGFGQSFEILRRTPAALGEDLGEGRTRMLSLFQANPRGQRLVRLWGRIMNGREDTESPPQTPQSDSNPRTTPRLKSGFSSAAREVILAYPWPIALGAALGWFLSGLAWGSLPLKLLLVLIGGLVGLLWAVWRDIRFGVIDNNLGLCKGGTLEPAGPEGRRPGLCEWLHEGIQASAGLDRLDRPLTFRDLWCAPAMPGAPHLPCDAEDPPRQRSINLQLITTNVTHGRPYRLPLDDTTSRLFFKPEELKDYFPPLVLKALVAASSRYEKKSGSDPESIPDQLEFFELPGADMPLVVAARLSLSFPLLFSAVPLWAIDYEAAPKVRGLRRCLFTDGGASSNFPIHLFDAAMPSRPTFGMWLDRKHPNRPPRDPSKDLDVWLPEFVGQGRADSWDRFDPLAADPRSAQGPVHLNNTRARLKFLFGFLRGLVTSAVDWRDRTSMRLPHVRNRVARLRLERGEGGLHIGMSKGQILKMAHRYGTATGKLFVERFTSCVGGVSDTWREQRWVRLLLLIEGLKERLEGLKASAEFSAHTEPLREAIARAQQLPPIRRRPWGEAPLEEEAQSPDPNKCTVLPAQAQSRDPKKGALKAREAQSLETALLELQQLEEALQSYRPSRDDLLPKPELGLRARL